MFPRRNDSFKSFLRHAEKRPEPWRTGLGILLFLLLSGGLAYLIRFYGASLTEYFQLTPVQSTAAEIGWKTSKRSVLSAFAGIVLTVPFLWIVLRVVHGRSLSSLISENGTVNWRAFGMAVGFVLTFAIITSVPAFLSGKSGQQLEFAAWLVWLLPAIFVIFLQTTTEELIFRGYLLQQFATHFKSRWIWWLVPSILFGMLHYNVDTFGANAWLVAATATLFGLILADVTTRTGNLSVAMGLHFANNIVLALLIGIPGQNSALSLFLRDIDLHDIDQTRMVFLTSGGAMLSAYLIYLLVMHRRR